jgi:putative transcriptional regulator
VNLTGRLLVASPQLREPTFARTVVLLLDHGGEGAMGVVLNRPMEVEVAVVLPGWQPWTTSPGLLFEGGPVGLDSALGLVGLPGTTGGVSGVRRISPALGLVDLDAEPAQVVPGLSGLRVFAGYSGWATGQLEGELDEGSWLVLDAEARDAFTDTPGDLWRSVLRRQGGGTAFLASYPVDPERN